MAGCSAGPQVKANKVFHLEKASNTECVDFLFNGNPATVRKLWAK